MPLKPLAKVKSVIFVSLFILFTILLTFLSASSADIFLYEDIYTLKSILPLAYLLAESVNKLINPYKAINVITLSAIEIVITLYFLLLRFIFL